MGMKKSLLMALAMTIALFGPAAAGEPLILGIMAPVTGPWASEGEDMVNVVNIMVEEVNANGGINGRPVEIVVGDDAGDPRTAALAAQRLIYSDVLAVIGTYGSAVCEAAQEIYHDEGVVNIATGSTGIRLTEKGFPLFFRTCPRDDDQGRAMAKNVKALGGRNIAVIHDNSSYAKGLADESRKNIDADPELEIVFFDAITPGDRDYTTTLVKMKSANPDIIVFTGYYPEAGMLLRQKKDMRWDVPMVGGDATNNTALVEIAGTEAARGYYFISPPGPGDLTHSGAEQFVADYRAKHDAIPSSVWSMMAGDAFGVLRTALENIPGDPTPEKIGDYLHNDLKGFVGFTGDIAFNEKGDRVGDVYRLYVVDDAGEFKLVP